MSDAAVRTRRGDPRLRVLLAFYAAMYLAANVTSILAPRMVESNPELLIAGSSRIRHLLFVVPAGISPVAYSLIGFSRLTLAAVVCFLLGRWYGTRGFAWLDRQLPGERPAILRWLEKGTDKVGWLFVLLMPGSNVVCALVGHRRMSPRLFVPLVSVGIVFRLTWVWIAAKRWEEQLLDILDWIGRYQWWLIGAFLAIAVLQSMRRARAVGRAGASTTVIVPSAEAIAEGEQAAAGDGAADS